MKKFREKNSYLVRKKFDGYVSAMTIMLATKKGYQIRWHTSGNVTWELKDDFDAEYQLIENISTKVKDQLDNVKLGAPSPPIPFETKTKTTLTLCPICHGMGTVPDPKSTAGTASCPLCHGNKMIPEKTEITQ